MKKVFIFYLVSLSLFCSALFAVQGFKNTIIIWAGIEAYSLIYKICLVCIACTVVAGIALVCSVLRIRKTSDASDNETSAKLGREMKVKYMKSLVNNLGGKWKHLSRNGKIISQLADISQYTENLSNVTKDTTLGDNPTEILAKVESCMYMNVKKLLNYMQAMSPKDKDFLQGKLDECTKINEGLLEKARKFNIAVVDYINRDMNTADVKQSLYHVESYKQVVLEALDSSEIYLS